MRPLIAVLLGGFFLAGCQTTGKPEMVQNRIAALPPQNCGSIANMEGRIEAQYRETRQAVGVMPQGELVELLTSAAGTWTILTISPSGVACLALSGHSWHQAAPKPEGRGS